MVATQIQAGKADGLLWREPSKHALMYLSIRPPPHAKEWYIV
jgi:hypothetical protein